MEQFFAERSADSRFRALLVVFFAVMATGITCLGLFGVLAYVVALRTRELGIRMTLGAARSDIAGLVLGQGARMTGLGVVVGLGLVFWLTRYISSLLFGVVPLDPTTLVGDRSKTVVRPQLAPFGLSPHFNVRQHRFRLSRSRTRQSAIANAVPL